MQNSPKMQPIEPLSTLPPLPSHGRRRFLRGLVLTSAMALGGKAGWDHRERLLTLLDAPDQRSLPDLSSKRPGRPRVRNKPPLILPAERSYAEFLAGLGLRYIAPHEVLSAHRRERNGVRNQLPPRELWNRMVPTLRVADELRHRLGRKLTHITSAYRCPAYNRQCPGAASRSFHTKNQALDLKFDCSPSAAFAEAKKMREEKLFRGGLGVYSSFVHVDTRGYDATWS